MKYASTCFGLLRKSLNLKKQMIPIVRDRQTKPAYIPPEYIPQAFDSIDLSGALEAFKGGIDLPVVLTCRPERQGAFFQVLKKREFLFLELQSIVE